MNDGRLGLCFWLEPRVRGKIGKCIKGFPRLRVVSWNIGSLTGKSI